MDCVEWLKFFYCIKNTLSLGLWLNKPIQPNKPWNSQSEVWFCFPNLILKGDSKTRVWVCFWKVKSVASQRKSDSFEYPRSAVLLWHAKLEHLKKLFVPVLGGFCHWTSLLSLLEKHFHHSKIFCCFLEMHFNFHLTAWDLDFILTRFSRSYLQQHDVKVTEWFNLEHSYCFH